VNAGCLLVSLWDVHLGASNTTWAFITDPVIWDSGSTSSIRAAGSWNRVSAVDRRFNSTFVPAAEKRQPHYLRLHAGQGHISEYMANYHHERNHQGLGNALLSGEPQEKPVRFEKVLQAPARAWL